MVTAAPSRPRALRAASTCAHGPMIPCTGRPDSATLARVTPRGVRRCLQQQVAVPAVTGDGHQLVAVEPADVGPLQRPALVVEAGRGGVAQQEDRGLQVAAEERIDDGEVPARNRHVVGAIMSRL